TRGPMIEKQASVEIIREIHVEAMRLLAHDIELALACKLLVLRALLLLAPLAHEHAVRRNVELVRNDGERLVAPLACSLYIYGARRRVLLHDDPAIARAVAVLIDRERVLGHVCVVDAEAIDRCALRPIERRFEILPQTIREHLRAGARAHFCRFRSRRTRLLKILGIDFKTHQPTFDAAVEQRVAALRVNADRLRQRRVARQYGRSPSLKLLA